MQYIPYILSGILLLMAILFNYGLVIDEIDGVETKDKLWLNTAVLIIIIIASVYIGSL
jgi:hypothetical protein